jgi:hypothetical protein
MRSGVDAAIGKVKKNVLPAPVSLRTPMQPPWASTIPLAMARPRPAPLRRPESARQNRSKMRGT